MKTAMQIAIENIDKCLNVDDIKDMLISLIEKEKEQILKAFSYGIVDAYNIIEDEANQYYNETYN